VEGGKEKEHLSVFWLWTEEKFPGIRRVGVNRLNKDIPDSNPSWNLGVHWWKFYESARIKLVCKRLALLFASLLLQKAALLSPHRT